MPDVFLVFSGTLTLAWIFWSLVGNNLVCMWPVMFPKFPQNEQVPALC